VIKEIRKPGNNFMFTFSTEEQNHKLRMPNAPGLSGYPGGMQIPGLRALMKF